MKTPSKPDVTDGPAAQSAVVSSEWVECSNKLGEMAREHKAINEKSNDRWERAYHLGAAVAMQDARLEVLAVLIQNHSNDPSSPAAGKRPTSERKTP